MDLARVAPAFVDMAHRLLTGAVDQRLTWSA